MVKIQGHRGFSESYPENTLISFQKTYESDVFGIEMDIRVTADGEYIIMHDETVDRTTNGTGTVKFINYYGYIDTLDAGSWFSTQYTGTKVPTLDEVLSEFDGKSVKLILQMYFTGDSRIANIHDVVDKVVAKGMAEQVHFFAPPDDINEVKAYNSSFYTLNSGMATISTYRGILDNAIENNHNAVSISSFANDADLTAMVTDIHNAGKEVHISYLTDNYESKLQRFIDFGVDYVLGNNPQTMQDYVDSLELNPPSQESLVLRADTAIKKTYGNITSEMFVVKDYGLIKVVTFNVVTGGSSHKINIICVGDSNTFGLYLPTTDSYPSQLNTMTGDDVKVTNKGVSSDRVRHVVARLDDIKSTRIVDASNIIVLQIGTNDSSDARPPADIYNDINNDLVIPLQEYGFDVWSVTVPPRGDSNAVNDRVKDLNILLRGNTLPNKIIEFYNELVDENGDFIPSMYGSDDKHLSKEGAGVLARLVADQLGTI